MQDMIEIQLNTKEDYRAYIHKIFEYAKKIVYAVLEYDLEPNKKIGDYLKKNQIIPKKVNSWKGTTTNSKNNLLYEFNASPEFKKILLEFGNFFKIDKKFQKIYIIVH